MERPTADTFDASVRTHPAVVVEGLRDGVVVRRSEGSPAGEARRTSFPRDPIEGAMDRTGDDIREIREKGEKKARKRERRRAARAAGRAHDRAGGPPAAMGRWEARRGRE